MSDAEEDLRTTSDAILTETDKLEKLERRKRAMGPEDAERVPMSAEIARIGERLERATIAESELAREAAEG
jgi:hypothetical protein